MDTFTPGKDPTDTDAFTFDLTAFLGTESITGNVAAEIAPADMTVNNVVWNGAFVTVWLGAGGSVNTDYTLSIIFSTVDASGAPARGPLKRSGTFQVEPR